MSTDKRARIKDRRLVLLQFPEYQVDATALIEADIYSNSSPSVVITSSGETVDISGFLTRSDFKDYYFSMVTEKEFEERMAKYSNTAQMDQKLASIRENYVSNSDLSDYKRELETKFNTTNTNLDNVTERFNTFSSTTLPGLTTNLALATTLDNYVTKENQGTTLLNYVTNTALDTRMGNYFNKDEVNTIKDGLNSSINSVNSRFNNYVTSNDFTTEVNKKMNTTTVESKLSQHDQDLKDFVAEKYFNKDEINTLKNELNQGTTTTLNDYVTKEKFNEERSKLYSSTEVDNIVKDLKDTHYTKEEEDTKHNALKKELTDYKALNHTTHTDVTNYITENNKLYNTKIEVAGIKEALETSIGTKLDKSIYDTFKEEYGTTINGIKSAASTLRSDYDNHIISYNSKSNEINNKLDDRYTKEEINDMIKSYYTKSEADVIHNGLSSSLSSTSTNLGLLTNRVRAMEIGKLDKAVFDDLNANVLRTDEVERRIKAVNSYTKPDMDRIIKNVTDSVEDNRRSINAIGVNVAGMYSNLQLDTKFNEIKVTITDHTGRITALENNTVSKTDYEEDKKGINLSLDNTYSKTQINSIIANNNSNYYTKEEIGNLEDNKINTYDTGIKSFINSTLDTRLGGFVSTSDFNTFKGDTATKTELTTAVSTLSDNVYSKSESNQMKDNIISQGKSYTDNKVDTELTKYTDTVLTPRLTGLLDTAGATRLVDDRMIGYVTKEAFYDRMNNIPSADDLDSSIDSKMGQAVHTVRHIIANDVNIQLNKFYDYAIDNKKLHYNRLALDSKFKQFQDRNLSLLRYKYTVDQINRVKKRFVNYFTKDEIDTKFNFYFNRANIADASLYYTSEQTDKFLAGKLDTSIFRLFTDNTYGKQKIDTELDKKVDISSYNTAIQGLTGRVTTLETNYNTVAGSVNTLNTTLNSKINTLESTVNNNNSTLTTSIGDINGEISTIKTALSRFKNEEQLKNLIDSKITGKLNIDDYNLEKQSFVTTGKLTTEIRGVVDSTYGREIIDNKISEVNNKIKSESDINTLIDNKLAAYSSSTDIESKINTKVATAKSEAISTVTEATNTKLLPYMKTEDANNTYLSKAEMATKESTIDGKINDVKSELTTKISDLSNTAGNTYLKLTGGELSGPLKVQKVSVSNNGIVYDNNNLIAFKSSSQGSELTNYVEIGSENLDSVRFINRDGVSHYKDNQDYKFITTEVFDPFKADVFRKGEINTLLSGKVDKNSYDTEIAGIKSGYVTTETLNSNISNLSNRLDGMYTKQDIEKYVSDNYLKSNVFDTFKTNNKLEYEKYVRDKLNESNTTANGKISTLENTVEQNKNALSTSINAIDNKVSVHILTSNRTLDGKVNVTDFNNYKDITYTKVEVNKKEEDLKKLITASESKITALEGNIPTLTSGKLDKSIFDAFKPTVYTKVEVDGIKNNLTSTINTKANSSDLGNVLRFGVNNYTNRSLAIGTIFISGAKQYKISSDGISYSINNGDSYSPIMRYENIADSILGRHRTHPSSWTRYEFSDTLVFGRENARTLLAGEVFSETIYKTTEGKYGPVINEKDIKHLINTESEKLQGIINVNKGKISTLENDCTNIKAQISSLSNDKLDVSRFRTDIANYVTTATLNSKVSTERTTSDTKYAPKGEFDVTKQKVSTLENKIGNIDFSQVEAKLKKYTDDKLNEALGEINKVLDQINGVVV